MLLSIVLLTILSIIGTSIEHDMIIEIGPHLSVITVKQGGVAIIFDYLKYGHITTVSDIMNS